MKITLLGATGATGEWVLRSLLDQGHQIIAYVRSPEKIPLISQDLTVVKGDLFDRPHLKEVMTGSDVVISCLGSDTTSPSDQLKLMAASVTKVMKDCAIPKIVYMATAGIDDEFRGPMKWFINMILGSVIKDHRDAARVYRQSGLTYVIAKPMQLKNGTPSHKYYMSEDGLPKRKRPISRGNVADFLVTAATTTQFDNTSIALAE